MKSKRNKLFGYLMVIKRDWSRKSSHVYWLCKCKCNALVSVRSDHLGKDILSCGCYNKEMLLKNRENVSSVTFKSNRHRILYYAYTKPINDYIKKRDKNKCVLCNTTSELHVHHILRKSKYPQYLVEPFNLVTLCTSCHLYTAHAGNTNKLDLDVASDLLTIVFKNSQYLAIPSSVINKIKQKLALFPSRN